MHCIVPGMENEMYCNQPFLVERIEDIVSPAPACLLCSPCSA